MSRVLYIFENSLYKITVDTSDEVKSKQKDPITYNWYLYISEKYGNQMYLERSYYVVNQILN